MATTKLPTAREVKSVLGQVDVGACRVVHHDNWGDARFPWRVYGPPDADGMRDMLDDFAQYREAVSFARKTAAAPDLLAAAEFALALLASYADETPEGAGHAMLAAAIAKAKGHAS